jgi:2-iminobutanoate/2-iminopropanoate deaminase
MSDLREISTTQAPQAIGPYSQAISDPRSGLLFCSGQIGLDPSSGALAQGGVEAEFRQVLDNVRALLTAANCEASDVVKTTIFLADMSDFARVNEIYAQFFSPPFPARSTVAAAGLPKGARVELEVIARRP